MTFLSRLILNPRSKDVLRDLNDSHGLHRRIMKAFPKLDESNDARQKLGVLHRLDLMNYDCLNLLVQSNEEPDWSELPTSYLLKDEGGVEPHAVLDLNDFLSRLSNGDVLRFRLRANPTRKINTKTGADGKKRNGNRIPLRSEKERLDWICRKGEAHGFTIDGDDLPSHLLIRTDSVSPTKGKQIHSGGTRRITHEGVIYEGILRVTDIDRFTDAILTGIGTGKAFGNGLLSVLRMS